MQGCLSYQKACHRSTEISVFQGYSATLSGVLPTLGKSFLEKQWSIYQHPGLVAYSWLRCGCIAQLHRHAKHRHCRPLWLYVLYPSPGREHIRSGFPLPVLLQRGQRAAALSPWRACVCNWNCVSSGVTQRLELHPESCPEAGDIHDSLKNTQIL